ncbi:hypothetical protein [Rhizobium leguminosarum]|uniref:hypothetical protein n=1 Tax=Rhizobium leguminosarum TaxID=384 RepID=UPI000B92D801|nr:hypothetical protein [Rhizobium leguminosarum]ASS55919.1 hypothetical protein CHR56_15850 [Rhizobium leguminosarum bv. viciae]
MGTRLGLFEYLGDDVEASENWCTHYLDYNTSDHAYSAESIQVLAGGSAVNGPVRGSFARSISLFKEGFGGPNAKGGELDGLYIVVRQDTRDGVAADGCGVLIDYAAFDNPGFIGGIEGATSMISKASSTVVRRISYQIGCMDYASGEGAVLYGKAPQGVSPVKDGIHLTTEGSNYFQYWMRFQNPSHTVYSLAKSGIEGMASFNSGSTVWRYVDSAGTLHFVNNNMTVDLALLDQAGNLKLYGSVEADFLDLPPTTSAPPIKQGRIWMNAVTGKLMICRDNATWTEV